MKKSGWIIISFLILFTFTLEAQIDWGVRVGAARSSLTQKVDGMFRSKGRFGFSVAGIADISLKNRWTLRPEVAFVHEAFDAVFPRAETVGQMVYHGLRGEIEHAKQKGDRTDA